jgi:hypothetical protein
MEKGPKTRFHSVRLRTSSGKTRVRISVDKQLHVEHFSYIFEVEDQNALQKDHIRGTNGIKLTLNTSVALEIVDRHLCGLAFSDVLEAFEHQVVVKRVCGDARLIIGTKNNFIM